MKDCPIDLQSTAFDHSAIPPKIFLGVTGIEPVFYG